MKEAEKYLQQTLQLAKKSLGKTSPNPLVGAIIVKDNKIVGKGYHQKAGMPHAEINALQQAGDEAKGATLYVNLEPCSHQGRTPPCTKSIIKAGIKKVVVSMLDPNPLVQGKEELEKAGIAVEVGVVEKEAIKLNEVYIKYITTNRPFIILKSAITIDGKITTPDKSWVTSEKSRKLVHQLRSQVDAILVGKNTVLIDDPLLTTRIKGAKDPFKIIVDTRLEIPLEANVLKNPQKVIIATTKHAPKEKIFTLERLGNKVLILPIQTKNPFVKRGIVSVQVSGNRCQPDGEGMREDSCYLMAYKGKDNPLTPFIKGEWVDMVELIKELGAMQITSVLIEGGASINASFLESGLVDKVLFFIAPKIAGNSQLSAVGNLTDLIKLKEISIKKVGEDILVSGYVKEAELLTSKN